jgi:two-component system phosphate regulon sensor histidine kinase PhoR
MKKTKLIWQIFPATLIIVLGAILAVSWYGSAAIHDFYIKRSIEDLQSRAYLVRAHIGELMINGEIIQLRKFSRNAGRDSLTRITVITESGVVLADSNESPDKMENHATRPEIIKAYAGEVGSSVRYSETLDKNMLYVAIPLFKAATPVYDSNDQPIGKTVLRLSMPLSDINLTLRALRGKVVIGCLVTIILAGIITLLTTRNITKPLEEMTQKAEAFARGEFDQRMVSAQRNTASIEVATLGTAMDNMATLLDDKIHAIETHRNQLETVFSSMNESLIAIDRDERVIAINKAAAKLFGVDKRKAHGRIVQEIVRNVKLQEQLVHILETGESVENELVIHDDNGEHFLQTSVVNLKDAKQKNVGVLLVMNDVTRIRRLESIRRDFVANVSHELRTPITSIRGYVETLLDGALESREDSEHFLKIVLKQSGRLSAIIDDLLSLSRIEEEASDGDIVKEVEPLCMVLDSAVQTCQLNADERNVEILLECEDNLQFRMNSTLMEQAVVNLLVNAIKYSKKDGKIQLRAGKVSMDGEELVCIEVKDNGIGIAREHLPRLFERFYRSDKARSRELGGTGLGLAIVKHIVGAHEGRIEVESTEGKGSSFTMFIPV